MPNISKEDFRSLELKIQTEIKKIFAEFIEELEDKTIEHGNTLTRQEPREPDRTSESSPAEIIPVPVTPKTRRKAKKAIAMNKILNITSHAITKHQGNILESDMAKIFRKKHRRKSS